MKIIKKLEELIEEEIEGVRNYAELAVMVKADHPSLAQALYSISTQEDTHQAALHTEVVKLIEEHRRTKGAPPPEMLAVYDFLHKRHIEKLAEARRYQELYKNS